MMAVGVAAPALTQEGTAFATLRYLCDRDVSVPATNLTANGSRITVIGV